MWLYPVTNNEGRSGGMHVEMMDLHHTMKGFASHNQGRSNGLRFVVSRGAVKSEEMLSSGPAMTASDGWKKKP